MRRLLSVFAALSALAACQPEAPPAAPAMPSQDYLVSGFERQKANLLQYVDAMPDSAWQFMPTPGVRSYAQQLEHIASATTGIIRQLAAAPPAAPTLPADSVYLNNRDAMRTFVAGSFDDAIAVVRAMTETDLTSDHDLFGMTKTGWQWVIGVQEHTAWTLGATVPYLRLNGVTPPSYLPF
ncbi:MAG: DinB family protein [Gemmatimonadales bacterium]